MEGLDREGHALQAPHQTIHLGATVTEDQHHIFGFALLDDADQRHGAVVIVHTHEGLVDGVRRLHAHGGRHLDGILRVGAREAQQFRRERGREQQCLAFVRKRREDLLHIVEEANLQHLVGLVQDGKLRPRERQEFLTLQVHDAARGADDDLGTGLEGAHLRFERFTAHDQCELDAARVAQLLEHVVDLFRQLARRCQDQPKHRGARRVDLGHHGRAEGERLARAGLGLGNHIASIQNRLDR